MKLQRYFDVSQSTDLPTFRQRLIDFSNDFDFGLVNAVVVADRPGQEIFVSSIGNTPQAFAAAAESTEDSRRDPVVKRLKRLQIPFVYDQDLYVQEAAGDLWEQQAVFGYGAGVAVALHLPDHKHFLLGFDRAEAISDDDDRLSNLLGSLQLLAVHAQDAALRLLGIQEAYVDLPQLTTRELEILRWTREGKSAWAVAEILSISDHTVNFHLRNIFRKLRCSSKQHAVLRAIKLGLLGD